MKLAKWNRVEKSKTLVSCPTRVLIKAGDDLLSRYSHYHGPQVLNGRVRNGNGCGHLGMVTGKSHVPISRINGESANIKMVADQDASLYAILVLGAGIRTPPRIAVLIVGLVKELINAVKQLAVSTG